LLCSVLSVLRFDMTSTTVALIIFLGSLGGIIFLTWRKMPLLLAKGVQPSGGNERFRDLVVKSTERIRRAEHLRVGPERMLQKTISKTRSLATKTESKTGEWIDQMQKKSKERKEKFSEEYWSQFKKRK